MFEVAIPIAFSGGIAAIQSRARCRREPRLLANRDEVERRHRSLEPLERELAGRLRLDVVFDLGVEALRDQDLAGGSLVGQARGEIGHRSDRRVVGAAFEPDLSAGRKAERDACAEVEVVAALLPEGRQLRHFFAERTAEANRPQRGIRHLDRIVEEELDAVALDEADRRVEPADEAADRAVELSEDAHQLLGLDGVDEVRPAAQVGEEHRDLAAVAAKNRLVAGGDDRIGELRREEPPQALEPPELLELRLHALLEGAVEIDELRGLGLDRVVVPLDPEQRLDAGQELVAVERLGNEVVRAGLDRRRLLRADAGREHDHRQHSRLVTLAEAFADNQAVGRRHHHVEQDEIGLGRDGEFERAVAVRCGDDLVPLSLEHRLEQADVLGDVVDDEDPSGLLAHRVPPSQYSFTVATKLGMSTGFERYPSKPAARKRSRSPSIACAVRASTGRKAPRASARSRASASTPPMSGSWMSIRTRSGACSSAASTALSPVVASSVR